MHQINADGLASVAAFLSRNHKQRTFTRAQLYAWAASAEEDMDNGTSPFIEIRAHDSITGAAVTLALSASDFSESIPVDMDFRPTEPDDTLTPTWPVRIEHTSAGEWLAHYTDADTEAYPTLDALCTAHQMPEGALIR